MIQIEELFRVERLKRLPIYMDSSFRVYELERFVMEEQNIEFFTIYLQLSIESF